MRSSKGTRTGTGHRPIAAPRRSERGFNLIELAMAMGLSGVIFMAITVLYQYQAQTLQTQNNVLLMQREARFALDHLRRDLGSLGSNTTPNSEVDALVCPKPAVPIKVIQAELGKGFVYRPDLNPNVRSIALTLFGSLDVRTRYKTASISGSKVVLTDDQGGTSGLPATEAAWKEVFNKDRYLRLSGADGKSLLYAIQTTSFNDHSVTLAASPPRIGGAQRCGYHGLGAGMWIDVQGFVRYRVIADTRPGAPTDANGNPMRSLLVRERMAVDGKTLVSQLALAENVVELAITDAIFDTDPSAAGLKVEIYYTQTDGRLVQKGGGGILGTTASAHPEQLRSLTVKLSVRAEVPDRDLVHRPRAAPHLPLLTYRLEPGRPAVCRVLTMATRIHMPTMIARNL